MERDRESILSISRTAIEHGRAQAICAPQSVTPFGIRLESGDIIDELEGDADVAPEVDGVSYGTLR
jgi:hypothetical protein